VAAAVIWALELGFAKLAGISSETSAHGTIQVDILSAQRSVQCVLAERTASIGTHAVGVQHQRSPHIGALAVDALGASTDDNQFAVVGTGDGGCMTIASRKGE